MGVGPNYQAEKERRIRSGIYHTPADPYYVAPEPEVRTVIKTVTLPNPDPTNYKLMMAEEFGIYLVVMAKYPDCTNYEGSKIMVFENTNLLNLVNQRVLDPHFSADKAFLTPIARFKPDDEGWDNARMFCKAMIAAKENQK